MTEEAGGFNLASIPVIGDEAHVDEEGNPRKDALIYGDKIVCHPSMIERIQEGLTFFSDASNQKPQPPLEP